MNTFHTAGPKSEVLKKCIAYYYFDEDSDSTATKSFIYYPHFKNALTIYKDSKVLLNNRYSSTALPEKDCYTYGFSKLVNCAAQAELKAPFKKIGVVFQPLGLNNFIAGHLSDYLSEAINVDFVFFRESMQATVEKVFKEDRIEQKVALLDAYFLSAYKGFHDEKMEQAMALLFENDCKYSVEEIANQLHISRKTLLRLFQKHQNCSVIDYIKMIQFRKSIEVFQNSPHKTKLTDLALNNAYYDQSDFIKHFKKVTGFNPKAFFKHVQVFGDESTFWTLC
jgi:AraC-like DNA-binding protein